jgi:hypothetical protein
MEPARNNCASGPQLDRGRAIVDLVVTLSLGLAAAYAIATGKASEATALTLAAAFHGLTAWRRRLR